MRVLLVDDHPLMLAGLREVVLSLGREVEVINACSEDEARGCLAHAPDLDLLVLDLHLSASGNENEGFELLQDLRKSHPALPVLVVSASDRAVDMGRALSMGAMGFVSKRLGPEILRDAMERVLAGEVYVPAAPLAPAPRPAAGPGNGPGDAAVPPFKLTRRQSEVLRLLLRGYPNKAIAKELHLSADTVKDHVQGILRALGVTSRTQAVLLARQWSSELLAQATDGDSGSRAG